MSRAYKGINLGGINDLDSLRRELKNVDDFLRDLQARLNTDTNVTAQSGQVTSVTTNDGDRIKGDINLEDGTAITLSQDGQDITIALDTDSVTLDQLGAQAGDYDAGDNALRAQEVRVDGDTGGVAGTMTITNATAAPDSTVASIDDTPTGVGGTSATWLKVYVGTTTYYIPLWT